MAHERSGLFIAEDEGRHAFAHQAFREYLAATYLVNAGEDRLWQEVERHAPAPDEWWEQVLLLAGAHPELSSGAAGRLIERLIRRGDIESVSLAASFARDMGDRLPGAQRKALQDWLIAAVDDKARRAKDRAAAGRALALAGDPRPGVGVRVSHLADGMPVELPDILWCEVPAEPFVMGSDKKRDRQAYDDETPQRTVDLPAYFISRYPITQAQYGAFCRAGGYRERRYWPEAERAGIWADGQVKGGFGDRPRDAPGDYGAPFSHDNHPVAGVTWYEALAFCRWLEERLREAGGELRISGAGMHRRRGSELETVLVPSVTVRLPSEAEWEKAARGTDGRIYP